MSGSLPPGTLSLEVGLACFTATVDLAYQRG